MRNPHNLHWILALHAPAFKLGSSLGAETHDELCDVGNRWCALWPMPSQVHRRGQPCFWSSAWVSSTDRI